MLLITGANGFLGARCVEILSKDTNKSIIATWNKGNDNLLSPSPENVTYIKCDLSDISQVLELFEKHQISKVIHTAAQLPNTETNDSGRSVVSNILTASNLIDASKKFDVQNFIYCSSNCVYGTPIIHSPDWKEHDLAKPYEFYGWSKYSGEEYLRLSCNKNMKGVSLRLSGIHGPGRRGGVVYNFCRKALSGEDIYAPDTNSRLQLLFLDDAVKAIKLLLSLKSNQDYLNINIASHTLPSIKNLAESIILQTNSKSKLILRKSTSNAEYVMDTRFALRELKYEPTPLSTGIDKIIKFAQST